MYNRILKKKPRSRNENSFRFSASHEEANAIRNGCINEIRIYTPSNRLRYTITKDLFEHLIINHFYHYALVDFRNVLKIKKTKTEEVMTQKEIAQKLGTWQCRLVELQNFKKFPEHIGKSGKTLLYKKSDVIKMLNDPEVQAWAERVRAREKGPQAI